MSESEFNQRLKTAVHSVTAPPYLETRIRSSIRAGAPSRSLGFWLVPSGIAAAICVGMLVVYQLGHLRLTATSQESYIATVSTKVTTLMRVGLGDHVHCSVFRKFPKNPPPVEKFEEDLGPEYRGLLPIVQRNVPPGYRLMQGHQCRYHGRRFVHFSFMNDSHLVSLVIARKSEGESFEAQGLLPALVQSGIPIYQAGVQRFAMNAFESPKFLVYVISDLPAGENSQMMIAMAPAVKELLGRL
jgi:hypothetical protein